MKSILKTIKENESTISMLLGASVVIVIGVLIFNYFSKIESPNKIESNEIAQEQGTGPEGTTNEKIQPPKPGEPTIHIVKEKETLWSLAEKYYSNGYKWLEIAQANNISNPKLIEKGQELLIPTLKAPLAQAQKTDSTKTSTAAKQTVTNQKTTPTINKSPIADSPYTVVKGDNLWSIAERACGTGFKWVEIAQANKLANPRIIHASNQFIIPCLESK